MEMKLLLIIILMFLPWDVYGSWDNCGQCQCQTEDLSKITSCINDGNGTLLDSTYILNLDNNITELIISGYSSLRSLEENQFRQFNKLKFLNLSRNTIEILNEQCLANLGKLETLDLSQNAIEKLPSNIFVETKNIRKIYLNGNKLQVLEENLFYNLTYLTHIYLNNNNLISINKNTFSNLPQNSHLNLNENEFEELNETIIINLPNLKMLDLQNNPWDCQQKTCIFRELALQKNDIIKMPRCASPTNVKGKTWKELKNYTISVIPNVIAEEGQNVTLKCEYTSCIPTKLIWKTKENKTFSSKTKQEPDNKFVSTLHLTSVSKEDKGLYICTVDNCNDCKRGDIDLSIKINESYGYVWWICGVIILLLLISSFPLYNLIRKQYFSNTSKETATPIELQNLK